MNCGICKKKRQKKRENNCHCSTIEDHLALHLCSTNKEEYHDLLCGTALSSDNYPKDYIYIISCMYISNCSLVVIWLDCTGDTHDGGGGGDIHDSGLDTHNYVDW